MKFGLVWSCVQITVVLESPEPIIYYMINFVVSILLGFGTGLTFNEEFSPKVSYEISDERIVWRYDECFLIRTSLYFGDRSEKLEEILKQDIELALEFMVILEERENNCSIPLTYSYSFKGDLIFIIKSTIKSVSSYTIINHFTTTSYNCKFSEINALTIQHKSSSIILIGNYQYYEVFNHGDLTDPHGSKGEIGKFLCNKAVSLGAWHEGCKNPSVLIGKKIESEGKSCVVEGSHSKKHVLDQGLCYINGNNVTGLIRFEYSGEAAKALGVLDRDLKSIVMKLDGLEYKTRCGGGSKKCFFYLDLNSSQLVGRRVEFDYDEGSLSCVIGYVGKLKLRATTSQHFSPYLVIVLLALTFLSIIITEIKILTQKSSTQ